MSSAIARYVPPSVASHMQNMSNRLARYRENSREQVARVTRTAEMGLVGGALGFLKGAHNRTEVAGLPIGPVVGVIGHALGFAMGGRDAEHLHNVGDAGMTVGAYAFGEEVGRDRAAKQNKSTAYPVA